MCKKLKNPALAGIVVLALSFAFAGPAFAGQALTGTIKPSPVSPTATGQGQALTGTQPVGAINGTAAINGISGQGLTGTQPKTVSIPIPLTGKSIPLSGTISGSGGTGVIVGVNLFTLKFP